MRLRTPRRTERPGTRILRDLAGFDLARATGVPLATAQGWADGTEAPAGLAGERLAALAGLVDRLAAAGLEDADERAEWLRHPNRAFGWEAPLDLVVRGEHGRLLVYVDELG